MAKVLPKSHSGAKSYTAKGEQAKPLDWRKKMSDHVAWALLVYTGLQIFVTVEAIKGQGASILPYLALVVLVAGIIPACRAFEKRWEYLDDNQAYDLSYKSAFVRDRTVLWILAIALPLVLTGLFKLLFGS